MPKLGIRGKAKKSEASSVEQPVNASKKRARTSDKPPVEPVQKVAYGVIAAGLVCAVVLLNGGFTDQLVAAKMRALPAPSTAVADATPSEDATKSDETKRADDADISGGKLDTDATRDASDEVDAKAPLDLRDDTIQIAPGAVVDKEALTKHLTQMKPEAFLALVASVDRVISETKEGEKGSRQQTLEQAYLKAEKKFGSRIDASKRLKLVDELNAVDYKYYVAEKGDTLLYLSQAFGVPLGQLMELNGIGDADKINAGMILLFPLETKQP